MRIHRIFPFALVLSLFAVPSGTVRAQSGSSPSAASPQPAAATSPSSAPAAAPVQPAPSTSAKQGKVWTNDEIDQLSGDRSISVVGKNTPRNAAGSTKTKGYSLDKDPAWYRQQLQPLQSEIQKLDAQIEKTKAFLSGEKVNDSPASPNAYYGIAGNPQEQLTKLEAKRDKDVTKVNDLLDRARHNDVPPGALR